MKFEKTKIDGLYIISLITNKDHRGVFFKAFCAKEFEKNNVRFDLKQGNISVTKRKHTIRGLHYQIGDAAEAKIVYCVKGSILDVMIDMRKDSPTFEQHLKFELKDSDSKMIYVPPGIAHGFITLEDNVKIFYMTSNTYDPSKENVIRWNDPYFGIEWPTKSPILSNKDKTYPDYDSAKN